MNNESLKNIYYQRNKDRIGSLGLYGKERGKIYSDWIGKNKKILDIGCRDGSLTKVYSDGNDVYGVDIDKSALVNFNLNTGGRGFEADINLEWPFEDNQFNVIIASELLEHIFQPEKLVKKINNSLKSDGIFIGSVPNGFSLINRIRLFFAQAQKTTQADPTHVIHFSLKRLKKVLTDQGFKNIKIKSLGRFSLLGRIMPGLFSFLIVFYCEK
ncbi:class I SAM-dependent methyltransferase [bacterium]|nr:class I SAM-dependent methyltransferase [bacterium]